VYDVDIQQRAREIDMTAKDVYVYPGNTYSEIKVCFNLKWRQRNALDVTVYAEDIARAALWGNWDLVARLLRIAGITK
jgi:hypothetical protein